jgi:hypothetical protein
LAEAFRKAWRDEAGEDIGDATGAGGHHQPQRSLWKILCRRESGDVKQRAGGGCLQYESDHDAVHSSRRVGAVSARM